MSAYTNPGEWYRHIGGIKYETTRPLIWEVGRKGSGVIVTVPQGTAFDVSIPAIMRWLFNPHDPHYLKAAALHDELLRRGWDRLTSGAQFHEALKADGVALWRRLVMWMAVSLFKFR